MGNNYVKITLLRLRFNYNLLLPTYFLTSLDVAFHVQVSFPAPQDTLNYRLPDKAAIPFIGPVRRIFKYKILQLTLNRGNLFFLSSNLNLIKWLKYVTMENCNKNPLNKSSLLVVNYNLNSIEHDGFCHRRFNYYSKLLSLLTVICVKSLVF